MTLCCEEQRAGLHGARAAVDGAAHPHALGHVRPPARPALLGRDPGTDSRGVGAAAAAGFPVRSECSRWRQQRPSTGRRWVSARSGCRRGQKLRRHRSLHTDAWRMHLQTRLLGIRITAYANPCGHLNFGFTQICRALSHQRIKAAPVYLRRVLASPVIQRDFQSAAYSPTA